MRTDPEAQKALYNDLTLKQVGERLGLSTEHVLALGEAGDLEIHDYRLPRAKRGVYRVSAQSVEKLRSTRVVKRSA